MKNDPCRYVGVRCVRVKQEIAEISIGFSWVPASNVRYILWTPTWKCASFAIPSGSRLGHVGMQDIAASHILYLYSQAYIGFKCYNKWRHMEMHKDCKQLKLVMYTEVLAYSPLGAPGKLESFMNATQQPKQGQLLLFKKGHNGHDTSINLRWVVKMTALCQDLNQLRIEAGRC